MFALWLNGHKEQTGDEEEMLREIAVSKINKVEQNTIF